SRAGQILELIRGGPRRRISWRSGQGQGALREAGYPNRIRRHRTTPRLEKRKGLPGEAVTRCAKEKIKHKVQLQEMTLTARDGAAVSEESSLHIAADRFAEVMVSELT